MIINYYSFNCIYAIYLHKLHSKDFFEEMILNDLILINVNIYREDDNTLIQLTNIV